MKRSIMCTLLLVICFSISAHAQRTVEERLAHIEASVDTLLSYHRGINTTGALEDILRDDGHLRWGIRGATGTILDKDFFVVNHHNNWKVAYWVAYYLSSGNLSGNQSRTNNFRVDPQLSLGQRAELADYRSSGFDRGHNAPAAAFKRSREAMSTTFLLSNMSPQTPALNRRIWRILEQEVRDLVLVEGEAWIVTGNLFLNADSQFVPPEDFIGNGRVAVPTHCFKAILSSAEDGSFSMFAFMLPNQRSRIRGVPQDFMISVDRLEEISGFDFFPDLPDDVENVLERQIADVWPL